MPWHVVANHSSCPVSKPFGVVKNADGSLVGCHPSKVAANKQLAALYANEGSMNDNEPGGAERAKYSADDIAKMVANGHAMPDGSYPIEDGEDLRNAIHAVGRGGASHDAIRKHIIKRAKALSMSDMIPDNWGADGSLASASNPGLHVRATAFTLVDAERGDGLTLEGYAAVFNSPTLINDWLGEYEEVIAPGAFSHTIRNGNPILMFDHGHHPVLGSMPIGAVKSLREDPHGLLVQARLYDNWMTEPLRQAISSDPPAVDGMSFRFSVPDGKDSWDRTRQPELRTVHEVKLFELGPVVFPAYKDTTVALRSLAAHVPGIVLSFNTQTAEVGTPDEPAERSSEVAAEEPDPVESQSDDDTRERRLARHAQRTAGFVAHLARLKETD